MVQNSGKSLRLTKRKYKAKAIALHDQGLSLREISKRIDVPHSTIANWVKDISFRMELESSKEGEVK